ncbi:MAG: LTA synthase family protein [Panacagrimonas sp.]
MNAITHTANASAPAHAAAKDFTHDLAPGRWVWTRPLWTMAAIYLLLSMTLRLGLWIFFGVHAAVPVAQLPAILGLGLVNDAIESVYLFIPLSLFLALAPVQRRRRTRRLLAFGVWVMLAGMLFITASEYFFFEEFDSRFNLVAVDYLIYPTEVIGDIHDEYPLVPLLSAFAFLGALGAWRVLAFLQPGRILRTPPRASRLGMLAVHAGLVVAITATWTAESLSVFDNRVSNELTANGPARFVSAFNNNHLDYPTFYRNGDSKEMLGRLAADLAPGGGQFVNLAGGDLTRRFEANPTGLGRLNVVMLVEESLGAEFVGAYGSTRGLTPEFDALAKEGMLFTRAFATGTRTVRGLEALTASLPPIPSESIVKRKGNKDIATLGKVMNGMGYQSSFLYGGHGAFDNMNPYFSGNGFAISDRAQIEHPTFGNAWGVSDEDLLEHALGYFDTAASKGKPFFSVIMSSSNHKPFTFPEGVPGVKPRGGGRRAGVLYADHAIGQFIRGARTRPWFGDTLFIIVADHDARVYGKANVPLNTYEIPLLFYAPGHIKPQRIDTPTSQIDVGPTALGLLGLAYQAPFFGQDVLKWPANVPRTLLFNHNHDVAALRDDKLCILGLRKTVRCEHYERTPGAPSEQTTHFAPAVDDPALIDLATAYYQTAYEQFTQRRYR